MINKEKYSGLSVYMDYPGAQIYRTNNFDQLPEHSRSRLEDELTDAAVAGFARSKSPEFKADVAAHLRGGDLLVIDVQGGAVGFALMQLFAKQETAYIAGVVKSTQAPSGIIESVVSRYVQESGLPKVAVRTQNDRVAEIMTAVCGQVVAMDRDATERECELLTDMELIRPGQQVDCKSLLVKGYYGSPMIGSGIRRRSEQSRVRQLTDRLDYDQGDALLLLGYRR